VSNEMVAVLIGVDRQGPLVLGAITSHDCAYGKLLRFFRFRLAT